MTSSVVLVPIMICNPTHFHVRSAFGTIEDTAHSESPGAHTCFVNPYLQFACIIADPSTDQATPLQVGTSRSLPEGSTMTSSVVLVPMMICDRLHYHAIGAFGIIDDTAHSESPRAHVPSVEPTSPSSFASTSADHRESKVEFPQRQSVIFARIATSLHMR